MTDQNNEFRRMELLESLRQRAQRFGRPMRIMEVCGTHTVAIHRSGLKDLLPPTLRLISGPGCPVCVTPAGYIDALLELGRKKNIVITTYGDMVRVKGSEYSLAEARAQGARVQVITSAMEALKLAVGNPALEVVFAAVGFETTTPPTADVLIRAKCDGLTNFSTLVAHKRVIPAMEALLNAPECRIDGFLCPGHVSVIIGSDAYKPIATRYQRPCVIAGFEPVQILHGLERIATQIDRGEGRVENVYTGVVGVEPLKTAIDLMAGIFTPADTEWRGLGSIPDSGFRIREDYERFDAVKKFGIAVRPVKEPPGCRCGQVLMGLIDPPECPLFGTRCRPEEAVGPCMVSTEGACQAWYKYQ